MRNKNICASRPQQFATTSFAFWCSSEITYWPFCRKYRLKVARRKNDLTSRSFFTDKIRRKIKSSVYEQQIFCLIMEQANHQLIFFSLKKMIYKTYIPPNEFHTEGHNNLLKCFSSIFFVVSASDHLSILFFFKSQCFFSGFFVYFLFYYVSIAFQGVKKFPQIKCRSFSTAQLFVQFFLLIH